VGHQLSQMCDLWKKYFLFLGDMCDHEWSSFIYILWDLMCDGSSTITDVWLVKKIFLIFYDTCECVRCFIRMCIIIFYKYSPPVMMIIFYIYIQWDQMCSGSPMITDVWLVKKIFFYFSVTCVTMSDHLLYIYNET